MFCVGTGKRLLKCLIKSDDPYIFRDCITRYMDLLNYLVVRDEHDNTLLHYITTHDCEQMVRMLLNIMIKHIGQTNLEEALEHEPTFAHYLKTTDDVGRTPVQLGLQSLKGMALKDFLYAVSGSLNYMTSKDLACILHKSVILDSGNFFKRMLEKVSNRFSEGIVAEFLHSIDDEGCTLLHKAVLDIRSFKDKLDLLRKHKCETQLAVKNQKELTPVQLGLKKFNGSDLAKFLHVISSSFGYMTPPDAERVFQEACDIGSNDSVHCMLKNGASRFLDEKQSDVFVAKSALSKHEPMLKLRTLQQFDQVCRSYTINMCLMY